MRERVFLVLFLVCSCILARAQEPLWEWAIRAGGTSYDNAYATASDTSGHFYVAGSFRSDSLTFDTITVLNASQFGSTAYIVKMNGEGNPLWMRTFGVDGWTEVLGMAVDNMGDLYACGTWSGATIEICGTTFTNTSNNNEGILVKYDADGTCLWARRTGGDDLDGISQVTTDIEGNVYVIGSYDNSVLSIGDTVLPVPYNYSRDIFLAKYLSDGSFQWARRMGGNLVDYGYDLGCDATGALYIAGTYSGYDFFIGNDTLHNPGNQYSYDGFLAKYDDAGNELWARRVGSTEGDHLYEMAVDPDGHIYFTGSYFGDELSLQPLTLQNSGSRDGFIAKMDHDGNALWVVPVEGPDYEEVLAVEAYGWGGCLVSGIYRSPVSSLGGFDLFNPDPGQPDFFVARLDESGNVMWQKTANGNDYDLPLSMTVSSEGVLIAGSFAGDSLQIGTTLLTNTTPPIPDIFVAKLKGLDDIGFDERTGLHSVPLHFPDPASDHLVVRGLDATVLGVEVLDLAGRSRMIGYQQSAMGILADVSALPPGVYVMRMRTFKDLRAVRFSVQR